MNPYILYGTPMPGLSTTTAYTGTAGTSTPLPKMTSIVRVQVSTLAFVAIGPGNVATVADMLMQPNVAEYFHAEAGWVVSAIQSAAGGNLSVTPIG